MKLIWNYMKPYPGQISFGMILKFLGTLGELSLPYILEHIIDRIVPLGSLKPVVLWGLLMVVMALLTRQLNIGANRRAAGVARSAIYHLRDDLFRKTVNLSGSRFDAFSLPSLTSRMTSDSYNVQNFMLRIQTLGIRAPIMLFGGIIVTMTMDVALAGILCIMVPLLIFVVFFITLKGVPLYTKVQSRMDDVVRIMRENNNGIRVVKALSREPFEKRRYQKANEDLMHDDIYAGVIMAIPGPFMQLCLNVGLTLVVYVGATRVNAGLTKPGVILAFLTYFNLILQAVMALNRVFVMYSKAKASADRIRIVLTDPPDQEVIEIRKNASELADPAHIRFDHVYFRYGENDAENKAEDALSDIDFSIRHGESLGIIGATGCGKTTVINLLMRFYDATGGTVSIDGRDVRSFPKDDLHRMFGVAFQNDIIFADSLENNIDFGRNLAKEEIREAAKDAQAADFIEAMEEGYDHMAAIKGANLSGGQKQRVMIARALAGKPEILILDDASSALDYRTDANLRTTLRKRYQDTTTIMIAQRISSVMHLDHIIVMDDGKILDMGTHEELLKRCGLYGTIYRSQMGGNL